MTIQERKNGNVGLHRTTVSAIVSMRIYKLCTINLEDGIKIRLRLQTSRMKICSYHIHNYLVSLYTCVTFSCFLYTIVASNLRFNCCQFKLELAASPD